MSEIRNYLVANPIFRTSISIPPSRLVLALVEKGEGLEEGEGIGAYACRNSSEIAKIEGGPVLGLDVLLREREAAALFSPRPIFRLSFSNES